MTKRELSIICVLGEEFIAVLADLQRIFEEKMAAQSGAFEEKLVSLSALLQKHVTMDEMYPVLQAMMSDAVGAIPVPRDGRDYDPEVLQQAVNDVVAKIPVPADGKSVIVDDVCPMIEQMVKDAVSRTPAPRDGRDYDLEVLQQAVNDVIVKMPAPADDRSATADNVCPMIKQMVKNVVSHILTPRDGRDYDPEVSLRAVNDAAGKLPILADGKSITPDDVRPILEQMVTSVVSHIPVPCDGRDYDPEVLQKAVLDVVSALPAPQDRRDATALEASPAIDGRKPFPRGTHATHQGGFWRAYERTHGMRGWGCLVDGVADIDVSMIGERSLAVVVWQSSGQCTEKTSSLPVMLHRGVFRAGEAYHPGGTVMWGDPLWHCGSMTGDKPGEAHSSGWILAAKRGRDAEGGKWQHY